MTTKICLLGTLSALLVLFVCAQQSALAQVKPLTVKLSKKVTYSTKTQSGFTTEASPYGYDTYESSRTISHPRNPAYYTIEILNTAMRKYYGVKIKWTALVKPSNSKEEILENGEHTVILDAKQKYVHNVSAKDSRSEVVGCSVEVYIDDSLIASATEPASAKDVIAKLKGTKAD